MEPCESFLPTFQQNCRHLSLSLCACVCEVDQRVHIVESPSLSSSSLKISEIVYPELKTTHRLNFDGSNFTIWKMKLEFVLVDNSVDYVLTQPKPESDFDLLKKWDADDFTCRHLILGAMSDDLYLNFHHHPTAKSLMDALAAYFQPTSLLHRVVLFRRYTSLRMPEGAAVGKHILEMGAMVRELEICGLKLPEDMHTFMLLNSLPESWNDVVRGLFVRLNNVEENLTLKDVIETLRSTEEWRTPTENQGKSEGSSNNGGEGSNKKKLGKAMRGKCYSCGKSGHYQSDCPFSDVL